MMNEPARRRMLISKGWIQAVVIVVLCGFLILGMLAYRTYTDEPPIPSQVVDPDGKILFSGADVISGQEVFLRNGLMEYGSIFGHGAYLGPDFTADYLHRAALIAIDHYGGLSAEAATKQTIADFKTNRYDGSTGVLSIRPLKRKRLRSLSATMPISLELQPQSMDCGPRPLPIPNS
jgi:nitric oxide reductase subunit B